MPSYLPTRAIFCADANADYIQFWPLVSQLWRMHHNAIPVLFFVDGVSGRHQQLDTTYGEVIPFPPLPRIPLSFQAQVLRLLAPALYPQDICVISDIDLFLMKPNFFARYGVANPHLPENSFLSLNRYSKDVPHISLTYQIARGSTFAEVFGIGLNGDRNATMDQIVAKIGQWGSNTTGDGIPWNRDETILTQHLERWNRTRGLWRRIITPGIWGRNGHHLTVTRFNKCKLPDNLANIVEYEPFHPLKATLPLAQRIFATALPAFQWPTKEMIEQWYTGTVLADRLSRHPLKRANQLKHQRPRRRPRVVLFGESSPMAMPKTHTTPSLTKFNRPRMTLLRTQK